MLGMTSGLQWNEEYGDVSDVTRMLYLSDDMASFAADRALKPALEPTSTIPLVHPPHCPGVAGQAARWRFELSSGCAF